MQRDYIMRMIEQFVLALASIIRSRKAGNYDQALEQIQLVSKKFLNTEMSSLLKYTPSQLLDYFKEGSSHLDTERGIVCADLLYELVLICKEQQSLDVSLRLKIMCLNLYISIIPTDKQFQIQEYIEKADRLIQEIDEQILPKDVQTNVDQYQKFLSEKQSTTHDKNRRK